MNREFQGLCLALEEAIESQEIQLLFPESWYWLHYRLFNCRDAICSETAYNKRMKPAAKNTQRQIATQK